MSRASHEFAHRAAASPPEIGFEPLTIRISAAVRLSGLSRSRIYELIQSGDLETHKVGRTTLIPYQSLKHLVTGTD